MKILKNRFKIVFVAAAALNFFLFGNLQVYSDSSINKVIATAPVMIDGGTLFHVVGAPSYPASKRAKEIARRIENLAKDPAFDPSTLKTRQFKGITAILAGDEKVMMVLPEDVHSLGITLTPPEVVAKDVYLKNIIQAIDKYREERTSRALMNNSLHALLRTAILAVLLFIVIWIFRKGDRLLETRFKSKIEKLEAKSRSLLDSHQIWSVMKIGLSVIRTLLILALAYVFINFVLSLFPWTRHVSKTLLGYVIDPLAIMAQAVLDYLPNLFFLVLLFFLLRYLIRLLRSFFSTVERGRIKLSGFDAEWARPTYRIIRAVLILLALVIAYPYIPGSDSQAFKGLSILVGVLFSLGSTSLISNIMAGYTMTYRRAFKVGDRVKIGDHVGEVTQIRQLVTHLRSLKNEEIVIPNSTILNGEIVNYSSMAKTKGLILHTSVGIGYEVSWRQVEAMLLMAAGRTQGLRTAPPPFVLQTSLGDFAVNYELNAFCAEPAEMAVIYSNLHRNIQDVFNEYQVQIMTPHYETDTGEPKIVPKEKWHSAPAAAGRNEAGPDVA